MTLQDRIALSRWLGARCSLAEVESFSAVGLVENVRFTETARRAYRLLWTWSAPRYGGSAGRQQDRYYNKCGAAALARRHARACALAERLT